MRETEAMMEGYGLTTANILYHKPDHPWFLQTFVWQELDLAPKFPALKKFLKFWEENLDGKLHSVVVTSNTLIRPAEFTFAKAELWVH